VGLRHDRTRQSIDNSRHAQHAFKRWTDETPQAYLEVNRRGSAV
jgi:hypothetical protein